jgi:hypothetical protein
MDETGGLSPLPMGEVKSNRAALSSQHIENQCLNSLERSDEAIHFLRFLDCFASLAMTEKASGDLLQAAAGRFKGRISKGKADDDSTYARSALPTSLYRIGSTGLPTYFVIPRRGASEALLDLPPKEGVGNAGCPMHPRPRVHLVAVESTRVTTSTPESPGIPARNGFNGLCHAPR